MDKKTKAKAIELLVESGARRKPEGAAGFAEEDAQLKYRPARWG